MIGIYVDLQIECDCGQLCAAAQDIVSQPKMLKQMKIFCNNCETGFFLHVQEIRPTEKIPCGNNLKRLT